MGEQNAALTVAEWQVMECLWDGSPLTGRELTERLKKERGWSRSTTLTLIARMEAKGAVASESNSGKKRFYPLIRREDMVFKETEDFLSRVYNGSLGMLVSSFTRRKTLSQAEIDGLYEILGELEVNINGRVAVSSSLLILIVIVVRFILKNHIGSGLRYALWTVVLLRLIIPLSLGTAKISVGSLTQAASETAPVQAVTTLMRTEIPRRSYNSTYSEVAREYAKKGVDISEMTARDLDIVEREISSRRASGWTVRDILVGLWLAGIGVVSVVFLTSNIHFALMLRRSRRRADVLGCPLPVYVSKKTATPCLFGLIYPAIYISASVTEDETARRHVIEHELAHRRHGDHIWSLLRGVCLAVHWYNPLVWVAASLSRDDSELACDEAAIRRLGESERAEYGRTLIKMTCQRRPEFFKLATTMTGGGKSIKERIMYIVKKPRTTALALVVAFIIAVLATGCAFAGTPYSPDAVPNSISDVDEGDPKVLNTDSQTDENYHNLSSDGALEVSEDIISKDNLILKQSCERTVRKLKLPTTARSKL